MSRLWGKYGEMIDELTEWLGPQAHKLHETVSMIEVFKGKAPLADRVEQFGSTCIRIGLDYGQDLIQHSHRRKLLLLIAFCQPKDVWISFPCGCWGPWSRMNMHKDPAWSRTVHTWCQTCSTLVRSAWNLEPSAVPWRVHSHRKATDIRCLERVSAAHGLWCSHWSMQPWFAMPED